MKWLWISFFLISFVNTQIASDGSDPQNPILIYPGDNNISRRYIKMLDRDIENALKSFDPQTGLLKVTLPENAVATDPAIEKLSITEKKRIADKPEYIWSYRQSR